MMKSSAQNTHAGFGDRFIAFANKVSDISGLVAAYLLVPLVVVFLIEIVSRNVFNHPTTWASGMCFLIGGCAAVLGFGYAMKSGAMVRIDAAGKGALHSGSDPVCGAVSAADDRRVV